MVSVGLKQKTQRTTARSPFESAAMNEHLDEDIEMGDETSSDEESIPEADESEKKLERMLFGDDAGFMGALKSQQKRADAMQLSLYSDEESGSADEGAEDDEGELDNMADADVGATLSLGDLQLTNWC